MSGAILRSVLAGRAAWWAPALVASLSSLLVGICLVQTLGTDATNPEIQAVLRSEGLETDHVASVGLSLSVMMLPIIVIVLATVSSAAITATTPDRSRWRLAGAPPSMLALFVLLEIVLVSLAGGVLGALGTALLGGPLSGLLNRLILPELAGIEVQPAPLALLGAAVVPPLTALVAGLLPALRGARVPAIRAVRGESEPSGRHSGRRGVITGLGLCALCAAVVLTYRRPPVLEGGQALTAGLGLAVLTLVVAGLGARTLVPLIVRAVSRLLPVPGAVWPLAGDGAVARAHVSGATVVALACGTGILGALTGMARTSEAISRALGSHEDYNLLDTYVICGVIGLLCAVGGACVLALSAGDRRREVATLRAAGMAPSQVRGAAAVEALLLTAASMVISLATTLMSTGLITRAAAVEGLPARLTLPWPELAVAGALTAAVLLAALVLPAQRALGASVRGSLAPG